MLTAENIQDLSVCVRNTLSGQSINGPLPNLETLVDLLKKLDEAKAELAKPAENKEAA